MNRFLSTLYRNVTCATAAALITLMLSATFVEATALPPGAHAQTDGFVALAPLHPWFGQPQPAVLVD